MSKRECGLYVVNFTSLWSRQIHQSCYKGDQARFQADKKSFLDHVEVYKKNWKYLQWFLPSLGHDFPGHIQSANHVTYN